MNQLKYEKMDITMTWWGGVPDIWEFLLSLHLSAGLKIYIKNDVPHSWYSNVCNLISHTLFLFLTTFFRYQDHVRRFDGIICQLSRLQSGIPREVTSRLNLRVQWSMLNFAQCKVGKDDQGSTRRGWRKMGGEE